MPFRQPTQLTIRACYFRGNAFSFPVESVLPSEQAGKQLIITPSVGYLLTTSVNAKPQPQQTLLYVTQADGSCLAQSIVTLLADGPALISGTVTLHDPLGERIVLTIRIETELFLESPTLTLVQSEPDEQVTALLHIVQQGAHTPVVLSTDNPNRFSLAIGNKPQVFTPTLTFTPVFAGTSVHVRYTPAGFGWHTARLIAKTPYTTQTVALGGRVDWRIVRGTLIRELTAPRVWKVATLTILLVSALSYLGSVDRFQPGPDSRRSQDKVKPTVTLPNTALVHARMLLARKPEELSTSSLDTTMGMGAENDRNSGAEALKPPYIPRPVKKATNKQPSKPDSLIETWSQAQPNPRVVLKSRVELAKSPDVSELEHELNQKRSRKH